MKLSMEKLNEVIREEVQKVLEQREVSFTVSKNELPITMEVLNWAKLDDVAERLKKESERSGIYATVSLTKNEAEEIAKAINQYLDDYQFADLNKRERRKLESVLNSLPYLDRFSK